LGQDDQSIRAVIAQWALALKTGDIAKMQEVYSPASHFYQSLSESFAQDYYQNNKINFDIKNMAITVQGSGARVKILEVTVIPDKYFTPTGNVRVIGDGLYQLRSIDLVKNANAWKINDFDYSPEYELPAITPPLRQP
jgi:hypothetical protein